MLLHTVSKIRMYGLLYILAYSLEVIFPGRTYDYIKKDDFDDIQVIFL